MPSIALVQELKVARQLAVCAGKHVAQLFRSGYEVEYKDAEKTDPVTNADCIANRIITEGLKEAFPSDGILAEESSDNMTRREYKRIWCIDPIDGTREFVAGRDEFVVMVGLAIAGCARLGVIYQPLQDILFWGEVNKGAWVEKGGSISALHVSNQERLQNAHAMVSRQRFGPKAKNTLEKLGISQRTAIGSIGLKSLWIAQGLADLYVSFASKTYEWDICAPQAIVEAAGGKFSDTQGNPILYNKVYPYHDTGIIAANAHVYPAVLHAIAEHT